MATHCACQTPTTPQPKQHHVWHRARGIAMSPVPRRKSQVGKYVLAHPPNYCSCVNDPHSTPKQFHFRHNLARKNQRIHRASPILHDASPKVPCAALIISFQVLHFDVSFEHSPANNDEFTVQKPILHDTSPKVPCVALIISFQVLHFDGSFEHSPASSNEFAAQKLTRPNTFQNVAGISKRSPKPKAHAFGSPTDHCMGVNRWRQEPFLLRNGRLKIVAGTKTTTFRLTNRPLSTHQPCRPLAPSTVPPS